MTTTEIVQLIKDVGVPVAMLAWFALRVEPRLEKIADAFTENTKATVAFTAELRALKEEVADGREDTGQHRAHRATGG